MSFGVGHEIQRNPTEQMPEVHPANNALQTEAQSFSLKSSAPIAVDTPCANAEVQAMMGGFGISNTQNQNDAFLNGQDTPPQPDVQLAQYDRPAAAAAIGIMLNVLQGMNNTSPDAPDAYYPPPTPQDYPPPNYPPQDYQPQNYPAQDYSPQNYPAQDYAPQNYPPPDAPAQDYPPANYPPPNYPPQDYSPQYPQQNDDGDQQ